MKRTTLASGRRSRWLELQCPECTATVRVAPDELVEGAPIGCLHCGIEAELRQDLDAFTRKQQWFLVDPLRERDADEERHS